MRRFISSRKIVIGLVTIICIIALLTGSSWLAKKSDKPMFIVRMGNDIASLVSRAVSIPSNTIGSTANSISNLLNTFQENQKLRAHIDELAQDEVKLRNLKEENEALKKELDLKATLTDYDTVSAVVISRSPVTWQSQIIINKGSDAHLKKGMPVLSGAGLIGSISEVNTNNAKVSLITDTNSSSNRFSITIKAKSGDVNGIISGFDANTNQLIMTQMTSENEVQKGDLVQTSGLGGIIPKGLYVGKVAKIVKDDYGMTQKIYIKSDLDYNNIPTVTVAVSKLND